MKRELEHFYIGDSYGGNQDWFRSFMMRIGGCGAETACDSSIYFTLHRGVKGIYLFNPNWLTRDDYVTFAHVMERYLWPRMGGIDTPDIYMEGYSRYLSDCGVHDITMEKLEGTEPYEKAAEAVKGQIDAGLPVPMLVLRHKNRAFKDYVWHWFLLNGYEETEDDLLVKAVTYSEYKWLSLRALWDSGHEKKGGLVLYRQG